SLLLSFGGVVGGVFNALIAPVIFNRVWEYPIVLVAAVLLRPWGRDAFKPWQIICFLGALAIALAPPVLLEIMRYNP
ncbi:hypothetical protein, partial [Calothrix sp. CCY 0018]|uniref:hypothetical protein n=1 Tax=Calothrix sp. CCY 0018 TaxID=3103864 RepID=UPI0039C6E9E5